jgi:hypothetical protein
MLWIMLGQAVNVGGRKRRPSVAEQMRACSWLSDRAFGKPMSMLEMMAVDAEEGRRR